MGALYSLIPSQNHTSLTWPRRLWAGGSIAYSCDPENRLQYFDSAELHERVESVQARGEKLLVCMVYSGCGGEPAIVERRCLVFLPADAPAVQRRDLEVKRDVRRDFAVTFAPTQHLLFRFTALSHNVHRLHYDSPFSRTVEGFGGNLYHGPLAVVFLLVLLKRFC